MIGVDTSSDTVWLCVLTPRQAQFSLYRSVQEASSLKWATHWESSRRENTGRGSGNQGGVSQFNACNTPRRTQVPQPSGLGVSTLHCRALRRGWRGLCRSQVWWVPWKLTPRRVRWRNHASVRLGQRETRLKILTAHREELVSRQVHGETVFSRCGISALGSDPHCCIRVSSSYPLHISQISPLHPQTRYSVRTSVVDSKHFGPFGPVDGFTRPGRSPVDEISHLR